MAGCLASLLGGAEGPTPLAAGRAVVFTGDDRSKAEAVHAKFLGAYGLAASQVPLLHVAPVKAWYTQWGIESFEET